MPCVSQPWDRGMILRNRTVLISAWPLVRKWSPRIQSPSIVPSSSSKTIFLRSHCIGLHLGSHQSIPLDWWIEYKGLRRDRTTSFRRGSKTHGPVAYAVNYKSIGISLLTPPDCRPPPLVILAMVFHFLGDVSDDWVFGITALDIRGCQIGELIEWYTRNWLFKVEWWVQMTEIEYHVVVAWVRGF